MKANIAEIDSEVKNKRNKKEKKVDLKQIEADEKKREYFEKSKKIFQRLPKDKRDVFAYDIKWAEIIKYNVLEKVIRPLVMKKLKEYLGEEEE